MGLSINNVTDPWVRQFFSVIIIGIRLRNFHANTLSVVRLLGVWECTNPEEGGVGRCDWLVAPPMSLCGAPERCERSSASESSIPREDAAAISDAKPFKSDFEFHA